MRTPYNIKNQRFSNSAHYAARKYIYPSIFGTNNLSYTNTLLSQGEKEAILDGELGIDRIVKVSSPSFPKGLPFTIQERFRKPEHAKFRDISIPKWLHKSNRPGELYKLSAGLFVYGYYDEPKDMFLEVVAVSVIDLMMGLANGTIKYTKGTFEAKDQTFIGINFDELKKSGAVRACIKNAGKHEWWKCIKR